MYMVTPGGTLVCDAGVADAGDISFEDDTDTDDVDQIARDVADASNVSVSRDLCVRYKSIVGMLLLEDDICEGGFQYSGDDANIVS